MTDKSLGKLAIFSVVCVFVVMSLTIGAFYFLYSVYVAREKQQILGGSLDTSVSSSSISVNLLEVKEKPIFKIISQNFKFVKFNRKNQLLNEKNQVILEPVEIELYHKYLLGSQKNGKVFIFRQTPEQVVEIWKYDGGQDSKISKIQTIQLKLDKNCIQNWQNKKDCLNLETIKTYI